MDSRDMLLRIAVQRALIINIRLLAAYNSKNQYIKILNKKDYDIR